MEVVAVPSVDDSRSLCWFQWSRVQVCSAQHAQVEVPKGSQELAEGHFSLRGGCGHNGMVPERGEQWKL